MEVLILDTDLKAVNIIDTFDSFIWTDRYSGYGDFELYSSVTAHLLYYLKRGRYLWSKLSEHLMLIEGISIVSNLENGNSLKITGRSIESILLRRIVWSQTILTGNFQTGILKLLNENVISATDTTRRISNFLFEPSVDPVITALTIDGQYCGEYLYDVILQLCDLHKIGFKVTLSDSGNFVFKLYSGVDRSYDQSTHSFVIFSPSFENINNTSYVESDVTLRTVSLVVGEGQGTTRLTTVAAVDSGAGSGLTRREMYTEAGDLSKATDTGTLTDAQYQAKLLQRGKEQLAVNTIFTTFEGTVQDEGIYVYGVDFQLGDIVQILDEYGHEAKVRVVELITSQSLSGVNAYPTFRTE